MNTDIMDFSTADERLQNAVVESWTSGSLIPLLKEELKLRIQTKRLSEGKDELVADFSTHPKHCLRPDELRKKENRKEQNRRAAERFRQKKRTQQEQLHTTVRELNKRNTELKGEISCLLKEREILLSQLEIVVDKTDHVIDGHAYTPEHIVMSSD